VSIGDAPLAEGSLPRMIKDEMDRGGGRQNGPTNPRRDPTFPANMIFVIDADGKTTRYTNDQFFLDLLKLALKVT
jgi:hypothetical protein